VSREEKIGIVYGIGGWFISIHFAVIILNNIVTQVSSFLLLAGTGVVDDVLIRNSILSVFIYGMPSMIMLLIGLTILLVKKRKLKSYYLKSTEQVLDAVENREKEVETVVFSSVGILVLLMSINSIVTISVFQYDSLTGLFSLNTSDPFFRHSLAFMGPQYLISLVEGLLGLFLFKKFCRKTLKSEKETIDIDAES
jgi:hypothetical protein